MKSTIIIWNQIVILFLGLILFTSCSEPIYVHRLNYNDLYINCISQKQSNWCWAACSEMVMKHFDPSGNYAQCEQAVRALNPNQVSQTSIGSCCQAATGNLECNHTNWPIFEMYNFKCSDTYTCSDYLSWEDMLNQIDSSKPLCLTYNWTCGGAHMIIMSGYQIVNNQLLVHLLDPYSEFARINDPDYPYPNSSRYVLQSENRSNSDHTLGRCYFDFEKISN
ncbi:MAG: papain-like cysteine protease family protein [Saprospiraceae bacterium]